MSGDEAMVYRKRNRATMLAVYFVFLCAGTAFMVFPYTGSSALSDQTTLIHVWHLFVMIGGLVGVLATLRRSVVVEMIAVPLINTGLLAYAFIELVHAFESGLPVNGVRVAVWFMFLAAVLLLLRRWLDLEERVHIEVDMRSREKSRSLDEHPVPR